MPVDWPASASSITQTARRPSDHAYAPATHQRIADRYDLVLAFEYENINTNIEAMAKVLMKRRTDVRLGPMYYNQLIVL